MFIQVIEGKVRDQEALQRQLDRWQRDLMPGAIGYLGSTGGCTAAGDCCLIARFESRDAAQRNSDRPEQSAWWAETERLFDGPVTFHDSEEVEVMEHGDLDSARFVQIMEGHVTNHDRAVAMERESDPMLKDARPDLLGSVTAYYDKDGFTEIAYFTSEDAARKGESQQMTDEMQAMFREWQDVMHVDRYLDLPSPWLMAGRKTETTG
jgi:hypothetical protein